MNKGAFLFLTLLISWSVSAQDESITRSRGLGEKNVVPPYELITNVFCRETQSLDGDWNVLVDPFENGYYNYRMQPMNERSTFFADRHFFDNQRVLVEYDFAPAPTLKVPGDWNTQTDKLYYYEGTVWYRKVFHAEPKEGFRYFLYFGAANYETIAAVNGHIVGRHVGGYTPFNFEVTSLLKAGENSVVVKVDNKRYPDAVPTVNSDWWNYGGITRSVQLVSVPSTFIRDYTVRLGSDGKSIEGSVRLDGGMGHIEITIPELKFTISAETAANGSVSFRKELPRRTKLVRWSCENPKLYEVTVSAGADRVTDKIGFRTVETRGSQILLNGEPIFCRGISIHEERPEPSAGRAWSEAHARTLLGWAREMGCNFVRLAHYPHNEWMVRIAEEMGILVWSEIPVYWTINWSNPATYTNAQNQLEEMIGRDKNRASVIIWSVANETPRSSERLRFLTRLIDRARELDPTRLVSAAMEKGGLPDGRLTVDDELLSKTDLISFNQYVGWYDGSADKCDRVVWTFPVEKPVIISEFGGGALYGRHGSVTDRFTEEYLVNLYEKNIGMLSRIPGLAGASPWILKDFRSPRRLLPGIQDDFNRKGLISEKGEKKDAFYVMQRWYLELKNKD